MAIEIFLKVTGAKQGNIQGESQDTAHKGEIAGLSFSWGETSPYDAASGLATGKRQLLPLTFRMATNKASPLLLTALINNETLTSAILTCRAAGVGSSTAPADNVVYTLTNGRLTKFHTTGNYKGNEGSTAAGALPPTDPGLVCEMGFTFQKISMSYKPVNPDGTLGGASIASDNWTT